MNASLHAAILALCLGVSGSASADDLLERIFTPRSDPLSTLPPIIATGSTLPGDTAPHSCTAAPATSGALTLADAVDLALCHNPQIAGAWAAIRVQAGR